MTCKQITTPSSRITKIGWRISYVSTYLSCAKQSCFCKTDTLWVVPLFLKKRGGQKRGGGEIEIVLTKKKSRLNSENTFYCSVQNILSSRLLSENIMIPIHNTIILPTVMYVLNMDDDDVDDDDDNNNNNNNNYTLPNIVRVVKSRRMRWAGHVARMGEWRGVHRVLVGKPEGKRPLGRP